MEICTGTDSTAQQSKVQTLASCWNSFSIFVILVWSQQEEDVTFLQAYVGHLTMFHLHQHQEFAGHTWLVPNLITPVKMVIREEEAQSVQHTGIGQVWIVAQVGYTKALNHRHNFCLSIISLTNEWKHTMLWMWFCQQQELYCCSVAVTKPKAEILQSTTHKTSAHSTEMTTSGKEKYHVHTGGKPMNHQCVSKWMFFLVSQKSHSVV